MENQEFDEAFFMGFCYALRKIGWAIDSVRKSKKDVIKEYEEFVVMCKIFAEEGDTNWKKKRE